MAEAPAPIVIAFINPRSGGGLGEKLYEKLCNVLGQDHVFDLKQGGPEPGLRKYRKTKNLRVLACGGDGTVGWVLFVMDKIGYRRYPSVIPLPLGTANDMSRILKWGKNFTSSSSADVHKFVDSVRNGVPIKMDRWKLSCIPLAPSEIDEEQRAIDAARAGEPDDCPEEEEETDEEHPTHKHETPVREKPDDESKEKPTTPRKKDSEAKTEHDNNASTKKDKTSKSKLPEGSNGDAHALAKGEGELKKQDPEGGADKSIDADLEVPETKIFVVNNYYSVGLDSETALSFHEKRTKQPGLFPNHTINKAWYGLYGLKSGAKNVNKPLHRTTRLEIDGKPVKIPRSLRILVFLQIPSYASGTDMWGDYNKTDCQSSRPTVSDQLFEVVGLEGLMHFSRLFLGVSRGVRLGQGKSAVMTVTKSVFAQVDGEPFKLFPSKSVIQFHNQSTMLFNIQKSSSEKQYERLTGHPFRVNDDITGSSKTVKESPEENKDGVKSRTHSKKEK